MAITICKVLMFIIEIYYISLKSLTSLYTVHAQTIDWVLYKLGNILQYIVYGDYNLPETSYSY